MASSSIDRTNPVARVVGIGIRVAACASHLSVVTPLPCKEARTHKILQMKDYEPTALASKNEMPRLYCG